MAKKKTTKQEIDHSHYCIEIHDWEMPYSFSINKIKEFLPGPYSEDLRLKITGEFLYPEKVAGKDIGISLVGERRCVFALNNPNKYSKTFSEPTAIGRLTVRGKTREGMFLLPIDVFPQLVNSLAAGKYQYLTLFGDTLYRGKAGIHSVDLSNKFAKEDFE